MGVGASAFLLRLTDPGAANHHGRSIDFPGVAGTGLPLRDPWSTSGRSSFHLEIEYSLLHTGLFIALQGEIADQNIGSSSIGPSGSLSVVSSA